MEDDRVGSWIMLAGAIVLEVAGTTCLKLSNGFHNVLATVLMCVFYAGTFGLLILVVKRMDLSIAYAIWSGVGTALIAAIGILWFHEPATALKLFFIGLIIAGAVGLELITEVK
jgi:small multidrug resistance pump